MSFRSPYWTVLGRPVDFIVANDGSLLISDDGSDRIYRLRHVEKP